MPASRIAPDSCPADRPFATGDRVAIILSGGREHRGTIVQNPDIRSITIGGPEVWVHVDGRMSPVPVRVAQVEHQDRWDWCLAYALQVFEDRA